MIPSDIRLYTWIDVEDVFIRVQNEKEWPDWLLSVRAYYNELFLEIKTGQKATAQMWLSERFAPRMDEEKQCIILESAKNEERVLQIYMEETDENPTPNRIFPSLARPTTLYKSSDRPVTSATQETDPPIIAFHSFKGGVGRTLNALAFALKLTTAKNKNHQVLLVDGDMEAPGLTWMLKERIPSPTISFVDLLSLVHGDSDPEAKTTIELVAERIKDMLLDGIYILPAFRAIYQFSTLEIKPEHLIQSARDPYILRKILTELGKKLKVDAVIVDLRAGLSELSTGLLLDPYVYRVIVTSLSAQSIEGTSHLLKLLADREQPKGENEPLPAVILSQIPTDFSTLPEVEEKLMEAVNNWSPQSPNEEGKENGNEPLNWNFIHIDFNPSLFVLPAEWADMIKLINDCKLPQGQNALEEWLPLTKATTLETVGEIQGDISTDEKRAKLTRFTDQLILAEDNSATKFLAIPPLRKIASDFRNRVPISVVIGAKGAGKTYTYLQIALREKWQGFVNDATGLAADIDADITPILYAKNFKQNTIEQIDGPFEGVLKRLEMGPKSPNTTVWDYLKDNLKKDLHEGQWRDKWLDIIAWKCGYKAGEVGAGKGLNECLKNKNAFFVALIDGLEDIFQDLSTKENQQIALRSLLQDVPEWLEQQPFRHLGLIVFVRQDMVFHAVKQNPAQLISKYSPYNLKWGAVEALRLVAWILIEVGILKLITGILIQNMEKTDISEFLYPLWGRKLGKEKSKEAHAAEWVISVLSDFKGQIQARDIVRLLNRAATLSQKDTFWLPRLLTPQAIRDSIAYCSNQKILEIEQENPAIGKIFAKLRNTSEEEKKKIPFSRDDVEVSVEDIALLEKNGVILREKEVYYMPEIFRRGLGFGLRGGARPKVIYLLRKAAK